MFSKIFVIQFFFLFPPSNSRCVPFRVKSQNFWIFFMTIKDFAMRFYDFEHCNVAVSISKKILHTTNKSLYDPREQNLSVQNANHWLHLNYEAAHFKTKSGLVSRQSKSSPQPLTAKRAYESVQPSHYTIIRTTIKMQKWVMRWAYLISWYACIYARSMSNCVFLSALKP